MRIARKIKIPDILKAALWSFLRPPPKKSNKASTLRVDVAGGVIWVHTNKAALWSFLRPPRTTPSAPYKCIWVPR